MSQATSRLLFNGTGGCKYMDEAADPKMLNCIIIDSPKNANISIYFVSEISKQTGKSYASGLATPDISGYMLQSCTVKLRTTDMNNLPVSKSEIFSTIPA